MSKLVYSILFVKSHLLLLFPLFIVIIDTHTPSLFFKLEENFDEWKLFITFFIQYISLRSNHLIRKIILNVFLTNSIRTTMHQIDSFSFPWRKCCNKQHENYFIKAGFINNIIKAKYLIQMMK